MLPLLAALLLGLVLGSDLSCEGTHEGGYGDPRDNGGNVFAELVGVACSGDCYTQVG